MHNSERLTKGPERCRLLMHPQDAGRLALADGARVKVSGRVGSVEASVEVSDEVMPGVVSLPHGWGHHRPGMGLRVASARPGVSLNDVTDEQEVDPLCGTAAFNGVQVQIEAIGAG